MKIIIETRSNGCTIKCKDEGIDAAFKYDREDAGDIVECLYVVKTLLYGYGGKYDKHRVEIKLVHGSGYICKDKKCTICHNKYDV